MTSAVETKIHDIIRYCIFVSISARDTIIVRLLYTLYGSDLYREVSLKQLRTSETEEECHFVNKLNKIEKKKKSSKVG